MYEMQGTSPGLAASGQPVAWPSRRGHAARQSQEPALGSGRPAPPTSRSRPRAVPVSNGESISTASARGRARPAPHLFPAFFLSTGSPQNTAGYPHFTVVFHRLLHRSSTGYQVLRGGTLSCLHAVEPCSTAFLIRFSCFLACTAEIIREISDGLSGGARGIIAWAAAGRFPNAAMRMIGRRRRHCRRRVRPGGGRQAWPS
jgi:hypothetical protein